MTFEFREIRKADIPDALAFAGEHGRVVTPDKLHHHLSLAVKNEGKIIAVALCIENEPGRHAIEIAIAPTEDTDSLAKQLADRALRKMQSDGIGTARITGTREEGDDNLWTQANWLDRVATLAPPDALADEDAASQDGEPPAPQPAQQDQAA